MGTRGPKRELILFMDADFMDDAKVESLSDSEFRAWMRMLANHLRFGKGSDLPGYAYGLSRRRVERFVELGLLDEEEGGLQVHNWDEWNGVSAYKRFLARERKRRQRMGHEE